MRKDEIEKVGKTLVKNHPKLKIYFVMSCDGTLDLYGNNGYLELVHYETAFEIVQESPDYELYMVLASKITEKRGFPEFEVLQDFELLIPKRPQEEIDAYYAQSDPNRKYLDTDYTPSSSDYLITDKESIPMSLLVLYAMKGTVCGSDFYDQKIYRHLKTGNYYEISSKFFVENMQQRLQAGEKHFDYKLCSINTTQVITSKAELESEDFRMFDSNYKAARRKASIAKLVLEL